MSTSRTSATAPMIDLVGGRGIQAGVDRAAEAGQPAEQLGPLLERLPLAPERERGGDAVADDGHRVEVALVERGVVRPLSMLSTPSIVARRPRAGR